MAAQGMGPGLDCQKKMVAYYSAGPNESQAQQVAPKHLEFVAAGLKKGTLLEAGPVDGGGGMLVLNFTESADAEALIKEDPFVKEGVVKYRINGWRRCVAAAQ
jgi:uncharacterized protein YciI